MNRTLIAATVSIWPWLAPQTASADTIYPWCLYDTRGGVNCGFVTQRQCMASKTANADMCGLNGLYDRVRHIDPYAPKRYRSYRG